MKENEKKDGNKCNPVENVKEKKEKDRKLSKIGKWLRSDSKPLMDLSCLNEQEKAVMMKLILK